MFEFLVKKFIKDKDNITNKFVRQKYGLLCGVIGIISNTLISAAKIVAGILSGSIAIIADGVNNLQDGATSVITFIAFKLSATPADREHPFGHQRIEYVSGLIVSILIIVVGIYLAESSIKKIINPEPLDLDNFILLVIILGGSIVIKIWQWYVYRQAGRKINSGALIASSTDSLNDIIATAVIFVALIVGKFTGLLIDGWMGLVVSIFIVINGVKLVKETMSPLLGEAPSDEFVKMVTDKIECYDGVIGTHDLVIHSYGPAKIFITVHVEVDAYEDVMVSHDIIDNIEQDFLNEHNFNVVIHMDPVDTKDPYTLELKDRVEKIINNIDKNIGFHDFRIVKGITHTNVLFDVVIPHEFSLSDNELKELVTLEIKKIDQNFNVVITFDHNYLG